MATLLYFIHICLLHCYSFALLQDLKKTVLNGLGLMEKIILLDFHSVHFSAHFHIGLFYGQGKTQPTQIGHSAY